MSTRSITTVRSSWSGGDYNTLAVIYRHHDGDLDGHGIWLHEFLDGLQVVNGIGGDRRRRYANGPGSLAAQLVSEMEQDGHDPDLMGAVRSCGQELHYQIDIRYGADGGTVAITVFGGPMTGFGDGGEDCTNQIFTGTVEEYGAWLRSSPLQEQANV